MLDAGFPQQRSDHRGAEFHRSDVGQPALEAADGRAGCGYDCCFLHATTPEPKSAFIGREHIFIIYMIKRSG
jgi:hypothetical protein